MKRTFLLLAIVILGGVAAVVAIPELRSRIAGLLEHQRQAETTADTPKQLYQCSMHPQIVSDKPDICPICQMQLQPVDGGHAGDTDAGSKTRKVVLYRHPMRADVTSPEPAKDEMGMDYIPVYEEDLEAGEDSVPGHASFTLSTERQQLIGVTKAPVERRKLELELRAVGKVAYDPTLYQGIIEYREALRSKRTLKDSTSREAIEGADGIIRSVRLKLRQLGLSEQQLRQMAESGADPVDLLLPGKSVWVYAQVYEYEVELLRQGQPAIITSPSTPGRTYTAKVVAVDPILDPTTRTARVRIAVATPDAALRPETFVHVKFQIALGEELAVPEEAVLDTGEHQIVFVVSGSGHFEPRSVELGRIAQGYYEVLSGLDQGEQVVTSANFLIDSESRFRAALKAFSAKPPAGHSD